MHASSSSGIEPLLHRRWLWISGGQAVSAPHTEPRKGLPSLTRAWQRGELSNFDYLMELNLLAGRRLGDLTRYPLLPWVLDMTESPEAGMSSTQVSPLTITVKSNQCGCRCPCLRVLILRQRTPGRRPEPDGRVARLVTQQMAAREGR